MFASEQSDSGQVKAVSPRKARPFDRIPYRLHGYGAQAACRILSERGYPISPSQLRRASNLGTITATRSQGNHRRFRAAELERFLRLKLDTKSDKV